MLAQGFFVESRTVSLAMMLTLSCGGPDSASDSEAWSGDPGNVVVHRMNKAEYNNTVRDLLGTELRPADDFPDDDSSHGFDNAAEALTVSPLHVELYDSAASSLATEALRESLS